MAQKYQNRGTHDGAQALFITAELVEDEESDFYGLYHTVDANNVEGHITAAQLEENWTPVEDAAPSDKTKK